MADEIETAPRARWSLGYTLNLGNFQSLRLDCEIEDSAMSRETLEELSERVYKVVEGELTAKVKEAKAELDGGKDS